MGLGDAPGLVFAIKQPPGPVGQSSRGCGLFAPYDLQLVWQLATEHPFIEPARCVYFIMISVFNFAAKQCE